MKVLYLNESECRALIKAIRTRRNLFKELEMVVYEQNNHEATDEYASEFITLNRLANKLFDVLYEDYN